MLRIHGQGLERSYEFSYQREGSVHSINVTYKRKSMGLDGEIDEEVTIGHRGVSCTANKRNGSWRPVKEGFKGLWDGIDSPLFNEILQSIDPIVRATLLEAYRAESE